MLSTKKFLISNKGMCLWLNPQTILTKFLFQQLYYRYLCVHFLIISLISTTLVIYLFCKHKHIRMLVASLMLHKLKDVEANSNSEDTNSRCTTLTYVG